MEDRIGYYARLLKATLNKNHVLRILRFLDADTLYTPETLAAFALEYRFIIEDEAPKAQKVLTQWAKKQAFPKRGDGRFAAMAVLVVHDDRAVLFLAGQVVGVEIKGGDLADRVVLF